MAEHEYSVEELIGQANAEPEEVSDPDTEAVHEDTVAIAPVASNELSRPVETLSHEEKVRLAKAATNFESIWQYLKKNPELELDVVDIISLDAEVTDRQTGEIMGKHRNTFMCEDGSAWSTTSDAVNSTVSTIRAIFGASGTWEQPLHLTFVKEESNNGNPFVNVLF